MEHSLDHLRQVAAFADALPVAIWVGKAPGGEVVYVNREFERVLGISPPEEASRGNYARPYGVYLASGEPYPEDQMPFERVMRARAPVVVDDIVIHRHDGGRTWLRVFASPLFDDKGDISLVVEAFTDISREVAVQRAQVEAERQRQLSHRLEAIGGLASGVAHDFNNLLAVAKLVASQLRKGERDENRLLLLQHLDEVADSAASLTASLIGFARKGRQPPRPVNVRRVAGAVVELARRTFGARVELAATFADDSQIIEGDAVQLERLVLNLLVNARDAVKAAGRVELRTFQRRLTAQEHPVLPEGRYLVLEVEDTGPGIDPAVRDRVFEPYVTTKTLGPVKGTGLGLATVYSIAKSHGGLAEVAQTGAAGTTMRVLLPASHAEEEAAPRRPRREAVPGSGVVLIADDEPRILEASRCALVDLGYEVLTADNADQVLEVAKARAKGLSAVVLDLVMPGPRAEETFLRLRALDPQLPVMVMTGSALDDEVQRMLDLGMSRLLVKPFDVVELSEALAEVTAARGKDSSR